MQYMTAASTQKRLKIWNIILKKYFVQWKELKLKQTLNWIKQ